MDRLSNSTPNATKNTRINSKAPRTPRPRLRAQSRTCMYSTCSYSCRCLWRTTGVVTREGVRLISSTCRLRIGFLPIGLSFESSPNEELSGLGRHCDDKEPYSCFYKMFCCESLVVQSDFSKCVTLSTWVSSCLGVVESTVEGCKNILKGVLVCLYSFDISWVASPKSNHTPNVSWMQICQRRSLEDIFDVKLNTVYSSRALAR